MVRYPNLVWAIGVKRLAHYELAAEIKVERTHFSRCLHGMSEFSPHQITRIAEVLGYPPGWLLEKPIPPKPRMHGGEAVAG